MKTCGLGAPGRRRGCIPTCWGRRSPLRRLHGAHEATMLSQSDVPPLERGMTWSTVKLPFEPQYWHDHPSRANTARRVILRWCVSRGTRTKVTRRITTGRGIAVCSDRNSQAACSSISALALMRRIAARRTEHTLIGSYVALRTSTRPASRPRGRCSWTGADPTWPGGVTVPMARFRVGQYSGRTGQEARLCGHHAGAGCAAAPSSHRRGARWRHAGEVGPSSASAGGAADLALMAYGAGRGLAVWAGGGPRGGGGGWGGGGGGGGGGGRGGGGGGGGPGGGAGAGRVGCGAGGGGRALVEWGAGAGRGLAVGVVRDRGVGAVGWVPAGGRDRARAGAA